MALVGGTIFALWGIRRFLQFITQDKRIDYPQTFIDYPQTFNYPVPEFEQNSWNVDRDVRRIAKERSRYYEYSDNSASGFQQKSVELNRDAQYTSLGSSRYYYNKDNFATGFQQKSVKLNRDAQNINLERSQYYHQDHLATAFQRTRLVIEEYDDNYFPVAEKVEIYHNANVTIQRPLSMGRTPFELKSVDPFSSEFWTIVSPIVNSKKYKINILKVYKIVNPYLESQYQIKRSQKKISHGGCRMCHTTVESNVRSICANNFNWRLSGSSRGSKYGVGVSFSPYPDFVHQFCKNGNVKIMFVVKVLIDRAHIGTRDQLLPNDGFDSTCAPSRKVYVKFEDSEFCPEYVVYYNLVRK